MPRNTADQLPAVLLWKAVDEPSFSDHKTRSGPDDRDTPSDRGRSCSQFPGFLPAQYERNPWIANDEPPLWQVDLHLFHLVNFALPFVPSYNL